jgi:hypothetical protein
MGPKDRLPLAVLPTLASLAIGLGLALRLSLRYQAEGYSCIYEQPLLLGLPLAALTATTTHFAILACLLPQRLLTRTAALLSGLAALLVLVLAIFPETGSALSQFLTPWSLHLGLLTLLLTGHWAYRLQKIPAATLLKVQPEDPWRFSLADLLLLLTSLALLLAVVSRFDPFWHPRGGNYYRFLLCTGVANGLLALATVRAVLGHQWLRWGLLVVLLLPLSWLAARQLQITLLFPIAWLGIFTTLFAAWLALLLLVLRLGKYRWRKVAASLPSAPLSEARLPSRPPDARR